MCGRQAQLLCHHPPSLTHPPFIQRQCSHVHTAYSSLHFTKQTHHRLTIPPPPRCSTSASGYLRSVDSDTMNSKFLSRGGAAWWARVAADSPRAAGVRMWLGIPVMRGVRTFSHRWSRSFRVYTLTTSHCTFPLFVISSAFPSSIHRATLDSFRTFAVEIRNQQSGPSVREGADPSHD